MIHKSKFKGNTLLIIDDDSFLTKEFIKIFSDQFLIECISESTLLQNFSDLKFGLILYPMDKLTEGKIKILDQIKAHIHQEVIPVLLVLPHNKFTDKAFLFDLGVIDYICHPYDKYDVTFKVKSAFRVSNLIFSSAESLRAGNLVLYPLSRNVFLNYSEVLLASKEFNILTQLVKSKNRIVTIEEIVRDVWAGANISSGNIYTQIYNLKRKLKGFSGEIKTVKNVGIILRE